MWWLNKPQYLLLLLLFTGSINTTAQNSDWSPVLKGKIEKALISVYESDELDFELVNIDSSSDEATPSKLEGHFFKVFISNAFKGYAYVAQAPSMKNVFDYLVIFNADLSIEKAKVLIYREQHGRQIGAARWLNQFKGMNTSNRPILGAEVDGISGATISARGMTIAINELLSSLSMLKEKGLL
ncbi:MAG: FMN-binding protein [Flavobacteriales bacterium]|nr:FMN-binding protein [Flavobacteriales bacterium]